MNPILVMATLIFGNYNSFVGTLRLSAWWRTVSCIQNIYITKNEWNMKERFWLHCITASSAGWSVKNKVKKRLCEKRKKKHVELLEVCKGEQGMWRMKVRQADNCLRTIVLYQDLSLFLEMSWEKSHCIQWMLKATTLRGRTTLWSLQNHKILSLVFWMTNYWFLTIRSSIY